MATFRDWLRASNQASTWLGLGLIAGLWTALALHLAAERDQSQRAWTRTTRNLARTVEEHTQRAIRETDKVLLLLRTALESNPEEFDLRRFTASPYFRNDLTLQVAILGPDGLMLSTNVETSAARVDLSDREHFRVHRASVDDTLFISKPVLGRASGKWSIQVTRRIRAPDGGFGGVIVGSLDPAILAGFYDAIDIGTGGAVTVVGRDGVVRASSGAAGDLGRSILGSPLLAAATEVEAGTLDSTSLLDGHARMVSFRNVPNYPLVVAVSVPREEISEATDAKAQSLRGYAGLASLLALVAMGISVRSRMRLDATRCELAAARDAAEAATRTRTAFLAMMSHEMRTPLNGVIGMANLMMETPLNAEQARYAATLRDSGDHLLQIINDVLDLTKLESDRVPVEEVAFDLRELAHGVMQIVAPTAQAKGLLLGAHVAADMPKTLRGDPAALRQVLLNLVGNGVKFTQSGHVKVEIAGRPAAQAGRMALRIDVRDSGIGIAPEQLPLLFQEFSQLDGSISRRFGGTGLGLAITKRIVERLGGSVEVQSSPGIGSRFTVNLVLPVENAAPPLPALEGLGVVVASPLALATSALAGTLAEMGAKVEEASDPARTLVLARRPECRAVLIDDGFGDALAPLLLRIQARTFGAPRVIVMTGIAGPARPTPLGGKAPDAVVTWPAGEGALATAILGVDLDDAASLADPEDEIVRTGFNVLLAEDNDTNRLVIATQLEKLGHAVQTVVNGKEAVEAVQRGAYDLSHGHHDAGDGRLCRRARHPRPVGASVAHPHRGSHGQCADRRRGRRQGCRHGRVRDQAGHLAGACRDHRSGLRGHARRVRCEPAPAAGRHDPVLRSRHLRPVRGRDRGVGGQPHRRRVPAGYVGAARHHARQARGRR
jgi:signal transduction histidine kinase